MFRVGDSALARWCMHHFSSKVVQNGASATFSFRHVIVFILTAMLLGLFTRSSMGQTVADSTTGEAMALLRNNCVSCHNAEKHKSGLLLTLREAALKGGENGPALIPRQSGKSHLIENLDADAETHMPPKKQLAADEIALLRRWIDAGAAWDQAALNRPRRGDEGGGVSRSSR